MSVTNSSRYFIGYSLLVPICLFAVGGCSSQPPLADLTKFMQEEIRAAKPPFELDKVEIVKAEQNKDSASWKLEVKNTVKMKTDLCTPIDMADAFEYYKHDPKAFDEAVTRYAKLREPERSALPGKLPSTDGIRAVFRKTKDAGETFSVTSTTTAEKKDSQWKFYGDLASVRIEGISADTVPRSLLPKDAVLLEDGKHNALTDLIQERTEFTKKVDDAQKAVAERLSREQAFLTQMVQQPTAWQVKIPVPNAPDSKVRLRFVQYDASTGKVVALVESMADDWQRQTLSGALKLPAPGESRLPVAGPDGWQIILNPPEGESFWRRTVLVCDASNQLMMVGDRALIPLTKDTDAKPLPQADAIAADVKTKAKPGRVWEGLVPVPGDQAYKIRLTFAEFRDDGGYVRLIFERPDEPHTVAVYEGAMTSTAEALYGWPMQFHRVAGVGKFGALTYYPLKFLSDNGGGAALSWNADGDLLVKTWQHRYQFRLTAADAVKDFESPESRWRKALAAGTRWSGKIVRGTTPAEKIVMTVAESRENGRLYQLTLQNPDDPQQYRTFLGTLDASDKAADSYALSLKSTSTVAKAVGSTSGNEGPYTHKLDAITFGFRLTPDGTKLISYPHFNWSDNMILTRDPEPASLPLDRESVASAWKEICVSGGKFKGKLTNPGFAPGMQTIDVELVFASGVDDDGNISAEMRLPSAKGAFIRYKGALELDQDNVLGFAMKLQKLDPGKGNSVVFGQETRNNWIYLRLDETRTQLIGMAGAPPAGWGEFLKLERAINPKK